MDILSKIVRQKKEELAETKRGTPLEVLKETIEEQQPHQGNRAEEALRFYNSICSFEGTYLITEVKKCSPSNPNGFIEGFSHQEVAQAYIDADAPALSILTERNFFGGSAEVLRLIRPMTNALLLRKDFIIDPYQIWEAKEIGADIILLIAAILTKRELEEFSMLASSLGLSVLLEIHNREEYEKVKFLKPPVLGVNNRNLKDFSLDITRTIEIADLIDFPSALVSESGIKTREDILLLEGAGARAFLIGESLVRSGNIKACISSLRGKVPFT